MANRAAAVTTYTCPDCGEQVFGFGAFGNHRKRHLAERRAAGAPAPARIRERRPRRIEDASALPAGGRDPSPPPAGSVEPSDDAPIDGPAGSTGLPPGPGDRPARPSIAAPSIRVSPDERARSVDEAIRDAMPLATLADIVRSLSVAISEADGAGPAGYLSEIQSAQVAALLYDSTIDTVVHRFGGDVNRFKAGLAAIIIVIAKGGVHVRAISARIAERRQAAMAAAMPAEAPDDAANGHDPISAAMALQARQPVVRLD